MIYLTLYQKIKYFKVLFLCITFNILGQQWPSGRQRAVRIYYELLKKELFYEQSF